MLCVSKHVIYDCVKLGNNTLKLGKKSLEKMIQIRKKLDKKSLEKKENALMVTLKEPHFGDLMFLFLSRDKLPT